MSITSLRIQDQLEKPLEKLARKLDRPKGWIVNQALREYIESQQTASERWQETLEALEDIRMGRVIEGDKVHAWLKSWGTKEEKAPPK